MNEYGLKKCPIFEEEGDFLETSPYGYRIHPVTGEASGHTGVDGVREGHNLATITAIDDGLVIDLRDSVGGYSDKQPEGNYVLIRHDSGIKTRYLHLEFRSLKVKEGDRVKKGQALGIMGDSGRCTGAHVHFQVEDINGYPIDPEPFIRGLKGVNDGIKDSAAGYIKVYPCKFGEISENVVALQKKLCQLSPELEEEVKEHSVSGGVFDGIYGQGMRDTIADLQEKWALKCTGDVDDVMAKILNYDGAELRLKLRAIQMITG